MGNGIHEKKFTKNVPQGGGKKFKNVGDIIYARSPRGNCHARCRSQQEGRKGETKGEKLVNAEESKKVVVAAEAQRNAARFEEFALSFANLIH